MACIAKLKGWGGRAVLDASISPLRRLSFTLRGASLRARARQSIIASAARGPMDSGSRYARSRNDGWICICDLAARFARGLHLRLPSSKIRGRREDRVLAAPAVPRAICANKTAHEHTGQLRTLRPSLRNGFTAYFVLFPENGSFASVACASYRKLNASTAAPEPHDFTVRFRLRTSSRSPRVHRISPHVRDDRERPSSAVRQAELCR